MEQIKHDMINFRVKEVRKALKMTQANFSKVISLSSGYLAGIETEKRKVNNRLIKLISISLDVNEQWLKTGEGPMFIKNSNEQITKLESMFRELDPHFKDYIFREIDLLLKLQDKIGKNSESALK